ncbi:MAG: response regulator transcription factor [Sphingopyxis sp.]|jgi:DNA-binding response OmpR family regulator|uniref:response regulator transcription factor n=1 Tax=unclassified Sphingopyxis TaxID=2614943 RepID=UPI0028548F15|nr:MULTISPECIES: response regulator transcription factor [unclassified Sphingopyxis]MDR7058534.1 DNA-binding response OmpR family regulator [Sphingopyxis sp. BE235]MDR7179280.1 DNA-binding response OmpR family regulator [Sphingopyxis sp. BE249]
MASSDIAGQGDRKLLVAVHHPVPARADVLGAAIEAAGLAVQFLPPHVSDLRPWVDSCFNLLLINPFLDWQEPSEFVRLAASIAGRRPLIALSDRDSLDDRMVALGAGADDAVGWTDNLPEVLARVASLLRRSRIAAGQLGEGELSIDLIDRRVERAGQIIRLPLREFDLLANLARVPDRPLSRGALLRAVWRLDFDPGTNRVEVHMSRLRAKVDRGFDWPMLRTVKGMGYALRSRPD